MQTPPVLRQEILVFENTAGILKPHFHLIYKDETTSVENVVWPEYRLPAR
jgi:hypothetical protein